MRLQGSMYLSVDKTYRVVGGGGLQANTLTDR